ncbi:MAG: 2-oxoacid:ferredoxin oxidoreductase subunit beta [Myxococcales bacterium FL481]|nr:MAG: 2-oxoacid:ferredoxin oxidoreductase subunit beta [Myxococcales bacterium FL481]
MSEHVKLTRKDFVSDQEVRWCPGCGDYAILATVQRMLPSLGVKRENVVFVSGIGCSSRFPYYMNTYGFHTIHGRAPAFATGIKLANQELDVWLVTGDGDGLSIGGNHLLHTLRRNVDLQILLFNNRIYGLTKGQYSPTSLVGHVSPSTPAGSVDAPVLPAAFALGSGARFVARCPDTIAKKLSPVLVRAHEHRGASFVEILQNCVVFNDAAWAGVDDKKGVSDHQLWLEHGQPMRFGTNRGLRLRSQSLELEIVTLGEDGIDEADLLVHDERNRSLAFLLATMDPARGFPTALGVLYCDPATTFDEMHARQLDTAQTGGGPGDLQKLLLSGHTWTVE